MRQRSGGRTPGEVSGHGRTIPRDPHGRARALAAILLAEPLSAEDDSWLAAHLADCEACTSAQAAYAADQALVRTLRGRAPQPPRDLWARTSSALEEEARRSLRVRRASHPERNPGRPLRGWPSAPLPRASSRARVASGLLVLALAVTSFVFNGLNPTPTPTDGSPGPSSPPATPITVAADVGWLQPAADGSYEVYLTHVGQVCPRGDSTGCAPIQDVARTSISLGALPESVSYSSVASQLVVVSSGLTSGASVIVVPVPSAPASGPTPSATTDAAVTPTASIQVTLLPSGSPIPSGSALVPSGTPGEPAASPAASPQAGGAIAIAENVIVVGGSAAYSEDGSWLAFAARPADGSAGPDIYVWKVGDALAHTVTSDHRSIFSAWLGTRLLGTRVEDAALPGAGATPDAGPGGSTDPGRAPTGSPSEPGPLPPPSSDAVAGASFAGVAFLLDPATGRSVDLDSVRFVRPVVDPTGRWVVYWEGTLVPAANGLDWRPGTGRIVVARWGHGDGTALFPVEADPAGSPQAAAPSPSAAGQPGPATGSSALPGRSGSANGQGGWQGGGSSPSAGPDPLPGAIQVLADGPLTDFDARFDPTGTRLAVWVGRGESTVGLLSLFSFEDGSWAHGAERGLAGMPALRGFSIDDGRLAWVAPATAGGASRRVQVLGWTADGIGSVESLAGDRLIVIR